MGKFSVGATTSVYRIIGDILVNVLAFVIWRSLFGDGIYGYDHTGPVILFLLIYMLGSHGTNLYDITTFYYVDRIFWRSTYAFFVAGAGAMIACCLNESLAESWRQMSAFFLIAYLLNISNVLASRWLIRKLAVKHAPVTVLIGKIEQFEKFHQFMKKSIAVINEVGYISPEREPDERYLAGIDQVENCLQNHYVSQVYIMKRDFDDETLKELITGFIDMGIIVHVINHCYKIEQAHIYVTSHGTYPIVTYHMVSLNKMQRILKRTVDIIGAVSGILLMSPVMLITAAVIKLTSPGPVVFVQTRIGQNGKPFKMYKFRSMSLDAEERKKDLMKYNTIPGNLMFKIQDDPRITPVGRFIRRTSIDELPQLFNVLLGNMSLIGTRPPTPDEVSLYQRKYWKRISIKPGITGAWQVSGRSAITDFERVVELDTEYIMEWSIWLDVKIIFRTIGIIIRRAGAY